MITIDLCEGVFAHSPDPVVFGPDRLISVDIRWLDRFDEYYHPSHKNDYYIDTYRRTDYPDRNWYG